jgi:hypothetical protein
MNEKKKLRKGIDMSEVFIQTLLDGDVIDVQGAKAASGTPLDAYPIKINVSGPTPPTPAQLTNAANQLWTFVAGPISGSFFIQSQIGTDLVIDITGATAASGTPIQVYTKKPTSNSAEINEAKNQLWNWTAVDEPHKSGQLYMTYYMIQSLLDTNLVVDIKGASTGSGSLLQVYTKKPTATTDDFNNAKNQLWSQVQTYYPPPK